MFFYGKFSSGPLRTYTDAHLAFVSPFEVSVKFVSEAIGDRGNPSTYYQKLSAQ
jgi:hypothetical protein